MQLTRKPSIAVFYFWSSHHVMVNLIMPACKNPTTSQPKCTGHTQPIWWQTKGTSWTHDARWTLLHMLWPPLHYPPRPQPIPWCPCWHNGRLLCRTWSNTQRLQKSIWHGPCNANTPMQPPHWCNSHLLSWQTQGPRQRLQSKHLSWHHICLRFFCASLLRPWCWASHHQPSHRRQWLSINDVSYLHHCNDYSSDRELQCQLRIMKSLPQLSVGQPFMLIWYNEFVSVMGLLAASLKKWSLVWSFTSHALWYLEHCIPLF